MTNPRNQKDQSFHSNYKNDCFHSNYKNDCINTCENTKFCTGANFWDPDTIFYSEVEIEKATLRENCQAPVSTYKKKRM